MATRLPLDLTVRGPLNTSDPKSDRPPGTLLEAQDLAHRWWGPRRGRKTVAWPIGSESRQVTPGRAAINFTSGDFVTGQIVDYAQDIKDSFTLDIVLRLRQAPAGSEEIFQWRTASAADLIVRLHSSATYGRVQVFFNGISGGAHLTGSAILANGISDDTKIAHIRVVRDGTSAYLYVNGVLDDSATGLSSPKITWLSAPNTRETWLIGGTTGTFVGNI